MRRAIVTLLVLVCGVVGVAGGARGDERPRHSVPKAKHGGTVIGLCDGDTAVEVDVKPGAPLSRDQAQAASDKLMADWRQKHPEAAWDEAVAQNTRPASEAGHGAGTGKPNAPPPPSANSPSAAPAQPTTATRAPAASQPREQTGTYESYDTRDELVWKAETQKFVDEGNAIFHDAKRLGGTVSISCDMCHPNAANTHPETYPKFQVQLQRVALLRDMINWCIENPVKGKALTDDSRTLRALEAYIIAQRKGQKLNYGNH